MKKYTYCLFLLFYFLCSPIYAQQILKVGARHDKEAQILGEMIAQILEDGGYTVERKFNLTVIVSFTALQNKEIDVYAEYSGILSAQFLKIKPTTLDSLNQLVKERFQLEMSKPYGFNNRIAIALKSEVAQKYNLKTISDLAAHPELKGGFTFGFLKMENGWVNLSKAYQLKQKVIGLEHGLSYRALLNHEIDFTDAYTTDGEIDEYGLTLLEDDLDFFLNYQALSFYQISLPEKAKQLLHKLDNILTDKEMQQLNSLASLHQQSHADIARNFLISRKLIQDNASNAPSIAQDIWSHTLVHLRLTFLSLLIAMLIAIPLGIFLYRFPRVSKPILYFTGLLQTIPSIALLALMIPFLGIGILPAIVALFLYALLPILRNTVIGFISVDPQLKKVATAMGLSDAQKLRSIELPLAMPMILTGIRTAAVINIGTATLAAFVGAGGLGEFIVTGLSLNNTQLILQGAIPSALLCIVIELLFELLEKIFIVKHLRQGTFQ